MRAVRALLLLPLLGTAQTPPPAALIRGVLLERDLAAPGEFSVRAADNQVFRYQFDKKTYVQRDDHAIDVPRLQPGDKVEVLSDTVSGAALRYARTVHVIEDQPQAPRPTTQGRYRAYRTPPVQERERTIPTGNMTFSGVVFRVSGDRVMLHTRTGDQSIQLRKDTRYLHDGGIVESADLKINTRVFIRAGKDLYDQVEAYQIIWGGILVP